ncbi:MAG: M14 family zinc carboxypeptidase [Actinomycetota bacterium]
MLAPSSVRRRRSVALVAALAAAALLVPATPPARSQAACPIGTEPAYAGEVPTARDAIGVRLGRREVTSDEADAYLDAVDAASDRVVTGTYATTVLGRPLRYAMVGRPEHVTPTGLEEVRQAVLRIRDPATPREEAEALAASTPAFLYVAGAVHGSEESGTDAALQVLYELADRIDCAADAILDGAVVVLLPNQNPDGRDADTRRNAYGFDMNRDWFARTQPETDGKLELLRRYPPLLFVDAHEFGYYRSFFAPNDDPVYHDAPDQVLSWIADLYAPALARAFRSRDWGFFNYGGYDFFMPGYGDTVPSDGFLAAGLTLEHYHGAPIALRLEKARLQFWLLLSLAARNGPRLLLEQHDAFVEAVRQGRAGLLEPNGLSNPGSRLITDVPNRRVRQYFLLDGRDRRYELALLVRRLQRMDVHVYRLDEPLHVPDYRPYAGAARARTLPAGTYWIPLAQPQKHWIQLMLNEDTYVPVRRTYDVTGWSSPLLMNLEGGSSGAALDPAATEVAPVDEPEWPEEGGADPRVGILALSNAVYAFEGVGQLRWLFDTAWDRPYEVLTPEDVARGRLDPIDVLVVPSGGALIGERRLGSSGIEEFRRWVERGGRYVGYKFGGALLADRLDLTTARFSDSPYAIEGTLIRVRVDRSSPLSEDVGGSVWVMFSDDDTIRVRPSAAPLRYPAAGRLATSGLALHTQKLAGQPAAVDEPYGRGRVVLFPYDLNFRGLTQGTQRLLWNAIFGP